MERREDYRFLYHGIDGERRIPINRWINANIKENVRDGSGSRRYTSAIHLFDNWNDAYNYGARFNSHVGGKKRTTTIVKCLASGVRKKEHSKSNVFLADRIKMIL